MHCKNNLAYNSKFVKTAEEPTPTQTPQFSDDPTPTPQFSDEPTPTPLFGNDPTPGVGKSPI